MPRSLIPQSLMPQSRVLQSRMPQSRGRHRRRGDGSGMRSLMRGRGGWTLPELLVGSLVAALLLGGAVGLLHRTARVVQTLVDREERMETLRTVWSILHQEVGSGISGRDWELEHDSHGGGRAIRLRAFRGLAIPCGWVPGSREGVVVWRGHRTPDPERDSLLVLTRAGSWQAVALEAHSPAGGTAQVSPGEYEPDPQGREGAECPPDFPGAFATWRLGEDPDQVLFLRYFERGRYSLEDGAFRYRRGGEGRQPLTPERVGAGSRFRLTEEGRLEVELELEPGGRVHWRLPFPAFAQEEGRP